MTYVSNYFKVMHFGNIKLTRNRTAFLAVMFFISVYCSFASEESDFDTAKAMYERRLFNVSYQYFHDFIQKYPDSKALGEAQLYLGESLYARGNFDRALTEFRLTTVNYPESISVPKALIRMGDCYYRMENSEKAEYYYRKAVSRAVENEDIHNAFLKLGTVYFERDDYPAAIENYSIYIDNYGGFGELGVTYYRLAMCYYLHGDISGTEIALKKAAANGFDDPVLLYFLEGKVSFERGDFEDSLLAYEMALDEATDSPIYNDILYQYGVSLVAAGDYEKSSNLADTSMLMGADDREWAKFSYLTGYSLFKRGDWRGARAAFLKAIEVEPNIAAADDLEFLLAVSFMESGDYKGAGDRLQIIATSESRWNHQAMYRLAWLSFSGDDMQEAYDQFGEVGAVSGELAPYCAYWQAECMLRLGNEAAGIDQFKYLLKEMPDSPMADNALFKYAKITIRKGDGDEGITNLEHLIDRYSESDLVDDAAYLIGRTYLDEQRYDLAIAGLDLFIKTYPDSSYLPRAHFDKGTAYFDNGDYRNAITVFNNIVSEFPTSEIADDAFYQSGYCKFEGRDYGGALAIFRSLADIYPGSPLTDEARYQAEMCRYKMGEYRNEIEIAEAYVTKYPDSGLCSGLFIVIAGYYDKKGTKKKAEKYYLLAEDASDSSRERYEARKSLADHYLKTGQFDKGISALGRIADESGGYGREAALYRMAEISEDGGDNAAALSYYSRIINEFPGGEYRSSALLKSGNRLRKLKLYEESNATLKQFIDEYPDSNNVNVARFYIAFNYQRIGEYGEAIKYHKIVAAYGRRSLAVQSYYWLGICERDIGNTEAARSYFTKIINNYNDFPDWVERAETELNGL